jgi:hypothetical protein
MSTIQLRALAASSLVAALVIVGISYDAAQAAAGVRAPSNVCFWEGLSWNDLSPAERRAWGSLGWNAALWDKGADPVIANREWDELSTGQQSVLSSLGYSRAKWDNVKCPDARSNLQNSRGVAAQPQHGFAPLRNLLQ